ncbi:MAG: hypothetical protein WCA83_15175 [Azonexus sp.]
MGTDEVMRRALELAKSQLSNYKTLSSTKTQHAGSASKGASSAAKSSRQETKKIAEAA